MKKVNVRDMLFEIVSRWYVILPIGLICAAVFGVYYYLNYDNNYILTDNMKEKLDEVWEVQEEYQKYVDANEKSGIMDMDCNEYYFVRVAYEMKGFPIDSGVYEMITDEIDCEDFRVDLINYSGVLIDEMSLNYLINRWSSDGENGKIIWFDFKTDNEQDAEAIMNAASELIGKVGNKYVGWETDAEWVLFDKWVNRFDGTEKYLRNSVKSFEGDLVFYEELLTEKKENLEQNEKICYQKYYLGEKIEISKIKLLKRIIGGFLCGSLISIIIVSLNYMFNSSIKTVEELKVLYQLPIICVLNKSRNENTIKTSYRKRRYRFDSKEYADAYLELISKETLLLYDPKDEKVIKAWNALGLEKVDMAPFIHKDTSGKVRRKDYESVIYVIALNNTDYREFDREVELCNMYHLKIEGIIAIV